MKQIIKLNKILKRKALLNPNLQVAYPDLWNYFGYPNVIRTDNEKIYVNPYRFLSYLIETKILPSVNKNIDYSESLSQINNYKTSQGDWLKESIIYSMLIRTSTAYDSNESGFLEDENTDKLNETGTFIKTILLLPYLKELGVSVLYLLPITKYSIIDKKGDLGSPYSVSNFFELDSMLSDKMVEGKLDLNQQFKALVEACHILNIRVVIDIIPRTNSVNSELIRDYPEWFYWIDSNTLIDYKPPYVQGIEQNTVAAKKQLKTLFKSVEVRNHLLKFKNDPKTENPTKWKKVLKLAKKDRYKSLNKIIQEQFNLVVAPAFSDCINDIQPSWDDVTYFRLYLDHPKNSVPYLNKIADDIKPYILYDVAKASLNPGCVINQELWNYLSDVIPYFQDNFGVDGARIDMGHALPKELIDLIIKKARMLDKDFGFIAEEMDRSRAKIIKRDKYNCIIGTAFLELTRVYQQRFNNFVYHTKECVLPQLACVETHDTPRVVSREGGKNLAIMTTIFNYFIPNTIPFINSGQEFFEIQPMNTGLDCYGDEQFSLPNNHQYFGKLALFDRYQFNYDHSDRFELINLMKKAAMIRNDYLKYLVDLKSSTMLNFSSPIELASGVAYKVDSGYLVVVANLDVLNGCMHYVNFENIETKPNNLELIFSTYNVLSENTYVDYWAHIYFEPGEVKIYRLEHEK